MATGTGKTYTAFQIVYRLLRSGMKKRILYLADRIILVDQSIEQDFSPVEKTIHKIDFAHDDIKKIMSYEVNFALYHQMDGQNNEEQFRFFPPEFFDLIIVDKCHHIASSQGQVLMQRIRAKYIYGLSATPNCSDRLDDIIYMLLGPVRHKYTAKEQADAQGLDRFVLPRFTRVVSITGEKLYIHKADDLIAKSTVRNAQNITDIIQAVADRRTPVILTKLKRQSRSGASSGY